jgi:SAM-dependent methyltransferase
MGKVFNAYARYYDLLYKDKAYRAESDYIHSLIQNFAPGGKTVLELGSGTGAHAEHLASLGYSVHGIDLSSTMVEQSASRKEGLTSEIGERLLFEVGDVRTVRTNRKYDVIISLFHVMSYQTSNQDLQQAFETAATHLNPGGVFIFDYWFGPAVLTQKPEVKIKRMEDEFSEILRIAEPSLDPGSNTVEVNFTVNISDKKSVQESGEVKESHLMRYLFLPELELFNDSLKLVESRAWMSSYAPTVNDWAAISIMKKK